jgi:hypothetical protein
MNRDKLERFMIDNRDEFDEFEPNPELFQGVQVRKPAISMTKKWNSAIWKVAAAIAIFIASYFFHDFMNVSDPGSMTQVNETEQASEVFKMLMEAEMYYTSQINSKKEEFNYLSSGNPDINREINYELVELDSVYADLKRDLKDNAANEEIIEAMIQNYRIKLEILEDVLQQMNAANNLPRKEEGHEIEL